MASQQCKEQNGQKVVLEALQGECGMHDEIGAHGCVQDDEQ